MRAAALALIGLVLAELVALLVPLPLVLTQDWTSLLQALTWSVLRTRSRLFRAVRISLLATRPAG